MLLLLKPNISGVGDRLVVFQPEYELEPRITTLCAFSDVSGMFNLTFSKPATVHSSGPTVEQPPPSSTTNITSAVEDEDELLYGNSSVPTETRVPENQSSAQVTSELELKPTYWVSLCRENGAFEICSLPDFKQCFYTNKFHLGLRLLVDHESTTDGCSERQQHEQLVVKELLLVCLGQRNMKPFLMARVNEDLLIYEAFPFTSQTDDDNRLKLRFKKVNHGLIISRKKPVATKSKSGPDGDATEEDLQRNHIRWLRPFDDISGYSGVFVCGPYPHWILMTPRGILRIHPMSIDGSVTCFTPFHNVNCPKGFLYFNRQGELRICVLPTHLSYDAPWPVRKVPLRCTPYFVAYHTESKTYGVVTSTSEICNKFVRLVGDGDKEFETVERDERFVYPYLEKFSVQLFSPITWEPIPNTKYELEEFERVTCMQCVSLKSEGTVTGLKSYVVLGTNYAYSEDVTCRGRIVIYDVIEVVPEPGQPLTKNKMKIEYDKEQRGAITALDAVRGFLVTAIGQKIYIWQLKDDDLCGVAFIDTQIYVQSLSTIKNLILVGDISKSITLLRYQEDMKVLSLVSRDIRPLEVYSVAYMVDNTNLSFIVSDRQKNLFLYSYMPLERESHGGQILLRRSGINIGSHVNTMFRVHCKTRDIDKRVIGRLERRQVTYFPSLDGGIGCLLPLSEKMFRRLSMLQNLLNTHIPHLAGLNPKSYRAVEHEGHELSRPVKNILDAELIWKFLNLTVTERAEIAKRLVTTVDQIVADLMEIDRSTAHF
jgi:cleavage and polyadenylation specificity factor subunit 1